MDVVSRIYVLSCVGVFVRSWIARPCHLLLLRCRFERTSNDDQTYSTGYVTGWFDVTGL
jgi:hypothetical protein